jgi:ATP-dependent exoDNAse (exonuclease V) beta subunit
MQLIDQTQREQALDATQSFIVQAPAGSGKTGLLTQRFLKLLAYVNQPEEILAITFTRKAASEMHERIFHALQFAQSEPSEVEAHQQKTLNLAKQALKRDEQLNWQLLNNPSRLQIKTIDSLCASLTTALPVLAKFGAQPLVSNDPFKLYEQAAKNLVSDIDAELPWSNAIKTLLAHQDNNLFRVINLLTSLLSKRDHWLGLVMQAGDNFRQRLEASLQAINESLLSQVFELLSSEEKVELTQLLNFASGNVKPDNPIHSWQEAIEFPGPVLENRALYLALPELMLTSSDELRKRIAIGQGFPAASSSKNKEEKAVWKNMKDRATAFFEAIANKPNLVKATAALKLMPPAVYSESQWELLDALIKLLPILCAKLRLVFSEQGEIDFTEMMLASLQALGDEDNPTDLTLSMDYKLQHLLVDEFQDTSLSQIELLKKLTLGWQSGDGRSLFLVGDPMQSIYRFRNAEVSLFLRCKEEGLGSIELTYLSLQANFRSQSELVNWFNHSFKHIFPKHDSKAESAVSYSSATAMREGLASHIDYQLELSSREEEAQQVIEIIKATWQDNPKASIAVLVQARHQLSEILKALAKQQIKYQAVDLASLIEQPHIQDLLALTRALLDPADRIAWLAILRAPWCGLELHDLLSSSKTTDNETIWQRLNSEEIKLELTHEAWSRLENFKQVLQIALNSQGRKPLATLVKDTWKDLGAQSYLLADNVLSDCETYFQFLSEQQRGGDISDFDHFETQLKRLFAKPEADKRINLHLMTIHKSKGLEFDTVILPGLDKASSKSDPQLMLWSEVNLEQAIDPVLAPIKASDANDDAIYNYLQQKEKLCLAQENRRLFYVAATRAKQHLHLLACQSIRNVNKESFLAYLFTAMPSLKPEGFVNSEELSDFVERRNLLTRLPLQTLQEKVLRQIPETSNEDFDKNELLWHSSKQKLLGTLIHRMLQQICEEGLEKWNKQRLQQERNTWQVLLRQKGFQQADLEKNLSLIEATLSSILKDDKGRWLLGEHQQHFAELPLSTVIQGKTRQFFIDRVFIDANEQLWFVDFKTAFLGLQLEAEERERLLREEQSRYAKQLQQYRKLTQQYFNKPPRFGLYFTSLAQWAEL